uniref:Uncharacterized protein n=1 Tax=Aegilops tauschii TaxID=37682 RepID=M8C467_AEGTA
MLLIEHCKIRDMITWGSDARASIVNHNQNPDSGQHAVHDGVESTVQKTHQASFVDLDVASSTLGEVKVSLKCKFDPSEVYISLDKLFQIVEDKFLRSNKTLPPDFSIGKLMNEICQYVAESRPVHSEAQNNGGSLQEQALETYAPFVKPIACVFTNEGKGWGLRMLDGLPKGAFICELVGEALTSSELHERKAKNSKHVDQVLLDASWDSEGVLRDEEALCLDPAFYGNSGDLSTTATCLRVIDVSPLLTQLALFTTKKMEAFEELTRQESMEGLRDSKLEEGQQWGNNTSSKDKVHWGRRPPFIGGKESNRYAHSPHRVVLPLMGAVLPLGRWNPFERQQRGGKMPVEPPGRYYGSSSRYYRWG